jgi:cell division protein FtsB
VKRASISAALASRARWLAPLAALGVAAGVLVFDRDGGVFALLGMRGRVVAAEGDLRRAEARRAGLLERIGALRNDELAVESAAREQLGMLRDGELVLRWSEPDASARDPEAPGAAVD